MARRAWLAATLAWLLIPAESAPARSAPSAADAREVMRVVLAFETEIHRRTELEPPPCVRGRVPATSMGGNRRAVLAYERPLPPARPRRSARPRAMIVIDSREIRWSPFFGWRRLADISKDYLELADQLPPEDEKQLRTVERAVMMAPRQRRLVDRIEPGWIAAPLAFCAGGDPNIPYLEFGSPAFHGDFAFVRAEFQCVMCGQGSMLALRRTAGGWLIVAAAIPWVS
jgi:hypothetical protein